MKLKYFTFVFTPIRFGETRCIVATRNIAKGEEILVNYRYDMEKFVPQWYKKLYEEESINSEDHYRKKL